MNRTVEQVLSFQDNRSGKRVVVAGDTESISALIGLLSQLSKTGSGLPAGTVGEGFVADMEYKPGRLLDSEGGVVPGIEFPPEPITFPEPVQG